MYGGSIFKKTIIALLDLILSEIDKENADT